MTVNQSSKFQGQSCSKPVWELMLKNLRNVVYPTVTLVKRPDFQLKFVGLVTLTIHDIVKSQSGFCFSIALFGN